VFGLSLSELVVIGVVALVVVGPQKLPGMLRTLGEWARKLRTLTHEMRTQSGIDDILRSEGIHGGLNELRGFVRGNHFQSPIYAPPPPPPPPVSDVPLSAYDPYASFEIDVTKEYPPEGADAYGALPDDLLDDGKTPVPAPVEVMTDAEPMAAVTDATEADAVAIVPGLAPRVSTGS